MAKIVNLFGETVDLPKNHQHESKYQKFKRLNNYGESSYKLYQCKNCKNLQGYNYHNKNYYKCELIGYSMSEATDVKLKNVCDQWEREK